MQALTLSLVLIGNSLQRIAAGASGVLVGLYLARLSNSGIGIGAGLVGLLGAVSFGAELVAATPMGIASDAAAPRALMTGGSLLGAAATQLFGMTGLISIFFLSRALEGIGSAAVTPPLLAHLTDVTDRRPALRTKVMSYFELSLLAGLALGGLLAGTLWRWLGPRAFGVIALVYVISAALLYAGATGSRRHGREQAVSGFMRALRERSLQRLAPIWLCVNTIVGLWLGPTLVFLLTRNSQTKQFLDGALADHPEKVGWVLLGYSIIFGAGVTAWSFVLPRMALHRVLRITLSAMILVCGEFFLLNHVGSGSVRWVVGIATALTIMVESGFTPAALALLAGAIGAQPGRGAAMGIYSVLLSIGAIMGSLIAAGLGAHFAVDGLIYGTLAMGVIAVLLLQRLDPDTEVAAAENA
ncbi:MAG TPA: MFS transporter [Verrucomicrobiae bacterium]|nr:MFS transporter [Verrucomicrobiae bacterium]